jgi:hypothetical protein
MALARHSGASPLPRPTAHERTLIGRSGGGAGWHRAPEGDE